MKEKIYLGIDLAKASSRVAALDSKSEAVCKPIDIANSKEGIKKLLDKLKSYKAEHIVLRHGDKLKTTGRTSAHILRKWA